MSTENLHVYRASAGSGKTFTLTREYLTYLFSEMGKDKDRPHSHILAVTFTNASTRDMKGKILKELVLIAKGSSKSEHRDALAEKFSCKPEEITEKAKELLRTILKDYSMFQISTIDRFFLSIMRCFIRELSLNSNYDIELGTDDVINAAVDNLFYHLGDEGNEKVFDWVKQYAISKMDDEKDWNVRKQIVKLSGDLFKENFRKIIDDKDFLQALKEKDKKAIGDYQKDLSDVYRGVEQKIKEIINEIIGELTRARVAVEDFCGGERSWIQSVLNVIDKIKKGDDDIITQTSRKKIGGSIDTWYAKAAPNDVKAKIDTLGPKIKPLLERLLKIVDNDLCKYYTAWELKESIYVLGILLDVQKEIEDYTEEERLLVLANVGELIEKIVATDKDAPFIYEKVGSRIEHYMIDEFQDTSHLQWNNFLPLLEESLGNGNENLIVGDVKQSIYRFRNSDWEILNTGVEADLKGYFNPDSLKDNHRSCEEVINFNNRLFPKLVGIVKDKLGDDKFKESIAKAYEDVVQGIPKSKDNPNEAKNPGGYVEVKFVEKKKEGKESPLFDEVVNRIRDFEGKGYPNNSIAVLVFENKKAREMAQRLMEEKIPVVSNDALDLKLSQSAQFVMMLLIALTQPSNKPKNNTNIFLLLEKYFSVVKKGDGNPILQAIKAMGDWRKTLFEDKESSILRGSFSTQVKNLIFHFGLSEVCPEEHVYIQTLLDKVIAFEKRYGSDMVKFIDWWNKQKSIKVDLPAQDAVRIITVHSSKGLEFENVICPLWNDKMISSNWSKGYIWCSTEGKPAPFNEIKFVPMTLSKKTGRSLFKEEYEKEKMQTYVDKLNATYVALTRAVRNLFVLGEYELDDKGNKSWDKETISCYLHQYINDCMGKDSDVLECGVLEEYKKKEPTKSEDGKKEKTYKVGVPESLGEREFALKGIKFHNTATEEGTAMHELLSRVNVAEDLPHIVQELIETGWLTEERWKAEKDDVEYFIRSNAEWYSGEYKILNEQDILTPDNGKLRRPDRVMLKDNEAIVVDYKFGQKKNDKYKDQVTEYMEYLMKMGYNTHGCICYIKLRENVKIEVEKK